jgi:iron-sulfur cluster assembly accessory protein
MINVTEAAAEKITELLTEEHREGAGLRVFVQGGGCSGFQYGLMIDEGEGDRAIRHLVNGVRLLVDPSACATSGRGSDFVDNNMGGGFTIRTQRQVHANCGCIVLGLVRQGTWPSRPPSSSNGIDPRAAAVLASATSSSTFPGTGWAPQRGQAR